MKLFSKFKTIIFTSILLSVALIGGAFSYWSFGMSADRSIHSGVEVDNIYENFSAGKPETINTYDIYLFIYLFPYTYYLYKYDGNTNPEDLYGYIERSLDINDNIVDNYISKNGYAIDNYYNQYIQEINDYNIQNITYLNTDNQLYDQDNQYSSPSIDAKIVPDDYLDSSDKIIPFKEQAEPLYQQLNRGDRLGYWYELDAGKGRFLPIKITFEGSIDPTEFSKMISSPRTDISDKNGWHNFKFANWLYVKDSNSRSYINPKDGFSISDKQNVFNIMMNLDLCSTLDESTGHKVIRLLPYFSNGKDYPSYTNDDRYNEEQLKNGRRDGVR